MKKLLLLLTVPVIIWFGCSNTVVAEFATVKEIKENSIMAVLISAEPNVP